MSAEPKPRLAFGNPVDLRWCKHGAHHVNKHNGSYQPISKYKQEWICNQCLKRGEK